MISLVFKNIAMFWGTVNHSFQYSKPHSEAHDAEGMFRVPEDLSQKEDIECQTFLWHAIIWGVYYLSFLDKCK